MFVSDEHPAGTCRGVCRAARGHVSAPPRVVLVNGESRSLRSKCAQIKLPPKPFLMHTHTLSTHPLIPFMASTDNARSHNQMSWWLFYDRVAFLLSARGSTHAQAYKQPCALCQPCAVSSTSHRAHSPVHLHTDRTTSSGLEQERDSRCSGWPHGGPSSGAEAAGAESAAVPGPCSGVYVHNSNYTTRTCTTAPTLKHCRYNHS
jgi:hypothetical protein